MTDEQPPPEPGPQPTSPQPTSPLTRGRGPRPARHRVAGPRVAGPARGDDRPDRHPGRAGRPPGGAKAAELAAVAGEQGRARSPSGPPRRPTSRPAGRRASRAARAPRPPLPPAPRRCGPPTPRAPEPPTADCAAPDDAAAGGLTDEPGRRRLGVGPSAVPTRPTGRSPAVVSYTRRHERPTHRHARRPAPPPQGRARGQLRQVPPRAARRPHRHDAPRPRRRPRRPAARRGDERACVIEVEGRLHELVNPRIVRASGDDRDLEGCLSIPGYVAYVTRREKVWVVAQNRVGKKIKVAGSGLLGRALQHELDHLDGKLYIDYLDSIGRADPGGRGGRTTTRTRRSARPTSALAIDPGPGQGGLPRLTPSGRSSSAAARSPCPALRRARRRTRASSSSAS